MRKEEGGSSRLSDTLIDGTARTPSARQMAAEPRRTGKVPGKQQEGLADQMVKFGNSWGLDFQWTGIPRTGHAGGLIAFWKATTPITGYIASERTVYLIVSSSQILYGSFGEWNPNLLDISEKGIAPRRSYVTISFCHGGGGSIINAETIARALGVSCARGMGLSNVHVCSDAESLIRALQEQGLGPPQIQDQVSKIRYMDSMGDPLQFHKVSRLIVRAPENIARQAARTQSTRSTAGLLDDRLREWISPYVDFKHECIQEIKQGHVFVNVQAVNSFDSF
ncbi:hypothetical protein QJS10_CPB20g00848 [Acorus calamus]|uniref:Uncharacterized protein n=1 Tax=Acorus calamus TaxID=4465 RepID=A0AAV9C819_ACOCL|nr:hypothetical protein QJS10_CPB20g00848 [Acorus calamus]